MVNTIKLASFPWMEKIIGSPRLFIVLSFIYPASYLLEINSHVYTTNQIIVTLIFVLLVSVITALAGGICVSYASKVILLVAKKCGLKTDILLVSPKLYRALLGGGGTIMLLVLMHSATRGLVPAFHNAVWVVPYLMVSFGVSILTYRFPLKLFNLILCGLIVTNGAFGVLHGFRSESFNLDTEKIQPGVVFKQKPNVYMVFLESYASLDIRKEIYGIDNAPLTRELNEKNYDIYKRYACYGETLSVIASTFLMDHHYYKLSEGLADGGGYRKIIGGVVGNRVINIFLNNGYRIDYSKFPSTLYHPSSVVNAPELQPLLQPIEVFSGLFAVYWKILGNSLWSSEIVQSFFWLSEQITEKLSRSVESGKAENVGMPAFTVIYAGAGHANFSFFQYPPEISGLPDASQMPFWKLNRVNNYWITKYKNMVDKSDAVLIELVRGLAEKDPEAIVILLGDHGTYFNSGRWEGDKNDPNENMLENGIQPAEVTRDLLEVFMAIKWPHGTKKPHEYFSNVNLFRQVFAVLAKDNSILKTQVSNDSFISANKNTSYLSKTGIYRTVKDGKLLDRWEPFTIPVAQ